MVVGKPRRLERISCLFSPTRRPAMPQAIPGDHGISVVEGLAPASAKIKGGRTKAASSFPINLINLTRLSNIRRANSRDLQTFILAPSSSATKAASILNESMKPAIWRNSLIER